MTGTPEDQERRRFPSVQDMRTEVQVGAPSSDVRLSCEEHLESLDSTHLTGVAPEVMTRKRLSDFARDHPETRTALEHWYRHMKRRNFASLAEMRTVFPTADKVGQLTVFNLGGNKVRLIAAIHYKRRKVYVRAVLTHEEYDHNRWKE